MSNLPAPYRHTPARREFVGVHTLEVDDDVLEVVDLPPLPPTPRPRPTATVRHEHEHIHRVTGPRPHIHLAMAWVSLLILTAFTVGIIADPTWIPFGGYATLLTLTLASAAINFTAYNHFTRRHGNHRS